MILAIDPGNIVSGYCLMDENYKPVMFGKEDNNFILSKIDILADTYDPWGLFQEKHSMLHPKAAVIEMVASYGMPVGQTVFDTCVWIGRFTQQLENNGIPVYYVKRKEYVVEFCGSSRANDANVRQYLIDRFAPNTANYGKGTKKEPGWFKGFSKDVWQAYAIGTYFLDKEKENDR